MRSECSYMNEQDEPVGIYFLLGKYPELLELPPVKDMIEQGSDIPLIKTTPFFLYEAHSTGLYATPLQGYILETEKDGIFILSQKDGRFELQPYAPSDADTDRKAVDNMSKLLATNFHVFLTPDGHRLIATEDINAIMDMLLRYGKDPTIIGSSTVHELFSATKLVRDYVKKYVIKRDRRLPRVEYRDSKYNGLDWPDD